MTQPTTNKAYGSFRVPNSIVQGLTTATPAGLNRLTSFQMVTLLGLMAHVSSKCPEEEVEIKVRDILEIVRVSKTVKHAVECSWTTHDGETRSRRYPALRYSPKNVEQVHAALLALHNQAIAIHYYDPASGRKVKIVHILDSFGYSYRFEGRQLDMDQLPADLDRINIGTDDRPVYRVCRRMTDGDRYEKPTAVTFRINRELAREIIGVNGSIQFTLFAHRVFDLFRDFMRSPSAIRMLVLTLRQTTSEFTRCLTHMLDELGFDVTHAERAIEQLETVIGRLRDDGIITKFSIDREGDRIKIGVNRGWYREETK